MSVEFDRESHGKFDSRTLIGKLLIGGLGAKGGLAIRHVFNVRISPMY